MKTITLEGKEVQISNESFEALKASLVKESHEREMVEYGGTFFYIENDGSIMSDLYAGAGVDQRIFNMGNYYHTRGEAVKSRDRQLAVVRLWDAFRKDYYFEPDWSEDTYKHGIFYNHSNHEFDLSIHSYIQDQTELPCFKSRVDLKSFIKENEDDLRVVFGVGK